ncbi:MAG: ABC transporter substrate-binding protein [Actinomycetota bacterium]|nr:ABC transporter substrate-binding protein [Actinomycetota bacterium]
MPRRGEPERFLTTVLFTDIVGSTEMAAELGDKAWRELVQLHHALVRSRLRNYGGREMDTAGDGFFAIFDAPASAIACALEIAADVQELGLQIRAGLHAGEVEKAGTKVGGITVPTGARISAQAGAGEVLVSSTVRDLAAGADLRFDDLGVRPLKGIPGEWRLYTVSRVAPEGGAESVAATPKERAQRRAAAVRLAESRPFWQRHARATIGIAIVLVLLTAGGGLFAWSPWRLPALATVGENTVGVIDPERNEIVGQIPVGSLPGGITYADDFVWVTNTGDDTVSRIDPQTRAVVDTIDVGTAPTGIAGANGSIWVTNSGERTVSRINGTTNRVVQTITVGNAPTAIASGGDAVWVANASDGTVVRIDAASGEPGKPIGVGSTPVALAVGENGVWVATEDGGLVVHLDPVSGVTLAAPIAVGARPVALAIGGGAVWVANAGDGSVSRIDPTTNRVTAVQQVGGTPTGVTTSDGAVWISGLDGSIRRLDSANPAVTAVRLSAGPAPTAFALVTGQVWFVAGPSAARHQGGTLRVVAGYPPPTDPVIFGSPTLVSLTGDGLVGYRRVGGISGATLVPDLATSLPKPTDAGKTYTFQLRPGIVYSTGEPVRPEDFRTAIERAFQVLDPGPGAAFGAFSFSAIQGAEACGDGNPPIPKHCDLSAGIVTDATSNTVTFHLLQPDPEFLYKLAGPAAFALPADAAPANEISTVPLPATGPYMVKSTSSTEAILVRNPRFVSWDPEVRPPGFVDQIVWTAGNDQAAQVDLVKRGEADYMDARVPPSLIPGLLAEYTPQVHSTSIGTTFMFMNTQLPPFDKLDARRAVNFAIDRARVAELQGGPGAATPTCQILPPNFPGYEPYCPYTVSAAESGGRWTGPDMTEARRLVSASGTKGSKVVITLGPAWELAPEYLVSVLTDLGYDASLHIPDTDREVFQAIYVDKTVQMGLFEYLADYPGATSFMTGFTCGSDESVTFFCDPALDAMVSTARDLQTTDAAAAAAQWAEVDRKVTDLALWAPLVNEGTRFVSARLGNYQFHPQWGVLLDQVWVQ